MSETRTLEELFSIVLTPLAAQLAERNLARLKVAFQDLRSKKEYGIYQHQSGWAASIIKVPVLIAAFRNIDERKMGLDDELTIDHRFTLDPTSEISYRQRGTPTTVAELLNYMILASCNESTNMLADKIGIARINTIMQELGCPNTRISHLLYQGAPLEDPGIDGTSSNTTTAHEMTMLLAGIYQQGVASPESCLRMKQILENAPEIEYGGHCVNGLLKRRLPPETRVGAKCGILDNDVMETGVINNDYTLTVILNKVSPALMGKASTLIATISAATYQHYYG